MQHYKSFGEFLTKKRHERRITSIDMANKIGISPGYYCDIEKDRRKPPEPEVLDKVMKALDLSDEDKLLFFDLAGAARSQVPLDLPRYIMGNEVVRVALRIAKDKADSSDWQEFIDKLKNKN